MQPISFVRTLLRSRIASAIVAIAWVAFIQSAGDDMVPFFRSKHNYLFQVAFFDLLALGCIWFPEIVSQVAARSEYLPPDLVALMGWLLLLSPILGRFVF